MQAWKGIFGIWVAALSSKFITVIIQLTIKNVGMERARSWNWWNAKDVPLALDTTLVEPPQHSLRANTYDWQSDYFSIHIADITFDIFHVALNIDAEME